MYKTHAEFIVLSIFVLITPFDCRSILFLQVIEWESFKIFHQSLNSFITGNSMNNIVDPEQYYLPI